MKGKLIATALAASLALAGLARAETPQVRLQDLLDSFRQDYGFPGATAAVVLPDGSVVTAAAGVADDETGTPMTSDSRMLAASIGKSFVAMTALSLESDGVLSRSDLVSRHLGDRDWFTRLPNHGTMTVGDLLRHASGLPDHVHLPGFQSDMAMRMAEGSAALTPEEAIAFVLDTDPLFPAGEAWAYSDTGYLLLGLVIEQASGAAYYDLVEERFLVPLGLTATSPSDTPILPGLAAGYVGADNPFGLPPRTMDDAGRLLWDPAMEWTGAGSFPPPAIWRSGAMRFLAVRRWRPPISTGCSMASPSRPMRRAFSMAPGSRSMPTHRAVRSTAMAGGSRDMSPACAIMPIPE